jgi:predicted phage-related endonuclease
MSATDRPNTPVPDELADVRAAIKRLETREAELKGILLSDPSARTGAEYLAEIREITSRRIDTKELRAAYPNEVDEHTHAVTTTRVELRGITDDGEVVSLRRKTA